MSVRTALIASLTFLTLTLRLAGADADSITWKKTVVSKAFLSEGVAIADGDKNVYSQSFACWAEDINGDGYPDLIVIGFPGAPCHWYENPQGKDGMWKQHVIWHSACNETPLYADLLGNGKRVLIMGSQP